MNLTKQEKLEAHQLELEKKYNKNQLIPRIKEEFREAGFVEEINRHNLDSAFGLDLLAQMVIHKRANIPTLVGILNHHCNFASQATADLLLKFAEVDLVDYNHKLKLFIVKYDISKDVQDEIDKYQFPLPLVIKPKKLEKNTDSPYLTIPKASLILKDNHHDFDICLDHLNKMNSIALSLNELTAKMIKNQWKNLDKIKEGETVTDLQKRQKAFEKYNTSALSVIDFLLSEGNKFYMSHKYDKRGRIYSIGYHVNYQGNDWNKAVIEFANKEKLNHG